MLNVFHIQRDVEVFSYRLLAYPKTCVIQASRFSLSIRFLRWDPSPRSSLPGFFIMLLRLRVLTFRRQFCWRRHRRSRRFWPERLVPWQRWLLLKRSSHWTIQSSRRHLLHLLYRDDAGCLLTWAWSQRRCWWKDPPLAQRLRRAGRRRALIMLLRNCLAAFWPWSTHPVCSDIVRVALAVPTTWSRLWCVRWVMTAISGKRWKVLRRLREMWRRSWLGERRGRRRFDRRLRSSLLVDV